MSIPTENLNNRYKQHYNIAVVESGNSDLIEMLPSTQSCAPPANSADGSLHWIGFPEGTCAAEWNPGVWEWYAIEGETPYWQTSVGTLVTPQTAAKAGHVYLGPAVCPYGWKPTP